ncbi:DUF3067 domain-containing protein [filamentous cyanobacterium CCP5]|nr:DUF3067 domain-containing protein [filamentous cyanobacterium CCP5]
MTGRELQALLLEKWGYSYDLQLRRTQGRIFLQVMWRYQEQASFPLSEAEYLAHMDQMASYINSWNQIDHITRWIQETREKPRLGKAINIPLDLGQRASEWLADEF